MLTTIEKENLKEISEKGTKFLKDEINAKDMTDAMIQKASEYVVETEKGLALRNSKMVSDHSEEFLDSLYEFYVCGTGYQADRCDADCVKRTISGFLKE